MRMSHPQTGVFKAMIDQVQVQVRVFYFPNRNTCYDMQFVHIIWQVRWGDRSCCDEIDGGWWMVGWSGEITPHRVHMLISHGMYLWCAPLLKSNRIFLVQCQNMPMCCFESLHVTWCGLLRLFWKYHKCMIHRHFVRYDTHLWEIDLLQLTQIVFRNKPLYFSKIYYS